MSIINIGGKPVGHGCPTFIIGEIGINHNGDMEVIKKLIDVAQTAGCDAVKFQTRDLDTLYTDVEMRAERKSPFGTTYGQYKHALELSDRDYHTIDKYCSERGILWSTSCWDFLSLQRITKLFPKIPFLKIASANATDYNLLCAYARTNKPLIVSTACMTQQEVDAMLEVLKGSPVILMHCTAMYPCPDECLNLEILNTWQCRYGFEDYIIGYSGHEKGVMPSVVAAALGASVIERHITLDRTMYGTDQAASLEPEGLFRMCRDIRNLQKIMGRGEKTVTVNELNAMGRLRKVNTLDTVKKGEFYV